MNGLALPANNVAPVLPDMRSAPPADFIRAARAALPAKSPAECLQILEAGQQQHPEHRGIKLRIVLLKLSVLIRELSTLIGREPAPADLELLFRAAGETRDPVLTQILPSALWPDGAAPPLARALAGRLLRRFARRHAARLLLVDAAAEPGMPDWVAEEAERAVWGDMPDTAFTAFEPGPRVLQEDVAHFARAVTGILAGEDVSPVGMGLSGRFTSRTVALSWLKSHVRFVDAGEMTPGAATSLAAELDVAPAFLATAAEGAKAVGEGCFRLVTGWPPAADTEIPLRMRDAAAVVALRAKPALCPFSGGLAMLRDSVAADVFLHRGGPQPCLVLTSPAWATPMQDAGWFFPKAGVMLFAKGAQRLFGYFDLWLRQFADILLKLTDAHVGFAGYLADARRDIAVLQHSTGHVGHDMWNCLSGWPRLFSLVQPAAIDHVIVNRKLDTYGLPSDLYPEHSRLADILVDDSDNLLNDVILPRRALVVTMRDHYIPQDLASRVLAVARRRCGADVRARIEALRSACDPLLLLTLRLENRMWREQEEGYIALVRRLAEDFPRLGIVLDGMNAGNEQFSTHARMSLDAELALAERIVRGTAPYAKVHNAIGCPIAESLLLCDAVDAYVAPIGAGMAKSRWITNKPGVAFSNDVMLEPEHPDGSLYDNPKFREAPRPAVFVDQQAVTNLGKGRYKRAFRANFSMRWESVHEKLMPLLNDIRGGSQRVGWPPAAP